MNMAEPDIDIGIGFILLFMTIVNILLINCICFLLLKECYNQIIYIVEHH